MRGGEGWEIRGFVGKWEEREGRWEMGDEGVCGKGGGGGDEKKSRGGDGDGRGRLSGKGKGEG